ncbi:phosphocholine cytidylyltransferase family protein [Salinisphaera sp. T31B1]|uniref:phosphocholine cytidylyltransferase family protein n=1 Tax=Salinisphaera sp. T31B1 TaxID=727963 RepID=UPI0033404D59
MHALLLAAGVGRRLTEITGGGPKCLLPFDGASLLERHLRLLADAGIHRLTVVTGCEAMQIEQALGALVPRVAPEMTVDTIVNPDFRLGSALSVVAGRAVLEAEDDALLMDADVLYDARMLKPLTAAAGADLLLMDRDVDPNDDEPVKIALRDQAVVGFDKQLPAGLAYDTLGESVGFFRLSPARARALVANCERLAAQDAETPHEHALRDLLAAEPDVFEVADVTGVPWIEIDYPEDVDRAVDIIAPRLEALA